MGNGFAWKLAISNIKKNRKFYLPYIVASVGIMTVFYIMCYLSFNQGISEMSGAENLRLIMALGCVVLGLFSFIFIFYINSFLMKRRKKEIGLYNILGMEKKHIAKILLIENAVTSILSIVVGLICGILFSKLMFMIICKAMKLEIPIGFEISAKGIVFTVVLFGAIFLLTLLKNQMSIGLAKPIELLKGSEVGEKEPRSRLVIAIIGAICLGVGYYIGITTDNPLSAILLFFLAVILVIIGTYLLFIAGSITILKALRKNKRFYYKPNHFTAISGMIYRMKQNAVGLANICILSTMVLVMISTTVCLRVGIDDLIDKTTPGDMSITANFNNIDQDNMQDNIKALDNHVLELAYESDVKIDKLETYTLLDFLVNKNGDDMHIDTDYSDNLKEVCIITLDDYKNLTGRNTSLANNEVIVAGDETANTFSLGSYTFTTKEHVEKFLPSNSIMEGYYGVYYLVVANDEILKDIGNQWIAVSKGTSEETTNNYKHMIHVYSEASNEKIEALNKEVAHSEGFGYEYVNTQTRSEVEGNFYGFSGGFLFLGIFLGVVFTFAAALIIYYKQISEGYYDKDKFEIMQKVGMSKSEVKKAIKSQVLMVFFAPLVVAGIHVLAAFNLIRQLLMLFTLYNVGLFAMCTLGTFVVFAVIYAFVYGITAREYYKIVQQDE